MYEFRNKVVPRTRTKGDRVVYFINRVSRAAAFGLGLILTASLGLAGQATFQLPVETHFGNVTLSPGEYRIVTPSTLGSISVVYFYGNGKVQAALPLLVGTQAEPGRSYLEMVNIGGVYYVRKYNAGIAGKTFTFGIPNKAQRETFAAIRSASLPVHSGEMN